MQADTVEGRGAALLLKYEFINAMGGSEPSWASDGDESFWRRCRLGICRGSQACGEGYGSQKQTNRKASSMNADVHAGIQLAAASVIQSAGESFEQLLPAVETLTARFCHAKQDDSFFTRNWGILKNGVRDGP